MNFMTINLKLGKACFSIIKKYFLSTWIFPLCLLMGTATITIAQSTCPGVTLSSQAEVDAWGGCEIVEGDLRISGADITDLSPLLSLQKVRGFFGIIDNAQLNDLSGLENLDSVGVFFITDNQQLVDISGFNLTQTEIVSISISDNDNLETINGLDNFSSTEFFSIFRNADLLSVNGFNGFNIIDGNFLISGNPNVNNWSGFSNLTEITGQVLFTGFDELEEINAFENLTTIGNEFILAGNAKLKNLNNFTSLSSLGVIVVVNNLALESMDAYSSVTNFTGSLTITGNTVLSDCCGILPILESGTAASITINDNPMFCSSETEIINNCTVPPVVCPGITLSSQAEVDAWGDCEIVDGSLRISGNDITDLSPLANLERVTGALFINDNDQLVSLSGLEKLDSVEVFFINDNPALVDISAFSLTQPEIAAFSINSNESLLEVSGFDNFITTGFMAISNNENLTSITGFNNVNKVNSDISFSSNPSLTNLDVFSSLTEVTGELLFLGNDELVEINGFENLERVGVFFILSFNPKLENIDNFTNISEIGSLVVDNMPLLENLDVFGNVTNFDGQLFITNNAALANCCGIFPILAGGNATLIDISNNPMFCSSETDILNNCAGSAIDLELQLTQSEPTPNQWTAYSVTATLSNTGGVNATGIQVSIPKPSGVVYTGGNEWTASQGNFDPIGSNAWNVGSIASGSSATITLNYFLLAEESPLVYGQVTAANELDADSSPNNGTPPSVNEDDESTTGAGGPPALNQDMTITDLNIASPTILPGLVLDYNFDLTNLGTSAIPGTFSVKSYISTDNVLSTDDIQDGIVPTGNFGPGLTVNDILGETTIPAGLAAGAYFLIVKVDADDEVMETNENNNIAVQAFTVDGVVVNCNGDIELTTQADVDAFGPCTAYQGNITLTGNEINNLNAFTGLELLDGDLDIRLSNLENLNGLESLQRIDGGLNIESTSLRDISALSSLTNIEGSFQMVDARMTSLTGLENLTSVGFLFFRDLDLITDLNALSSLNNVDKTLWLSSNGSLADISGLSNLNRVEGLDLRGMPNITDLSPLSNISGQLDERLLITAMGGLTNLDGLQNITGVTGRVQVSNSDALENVDGFLRLVSAGEFLLTGNSSLADCCGAFPLLNGNGVAGLTLIDDNLAGCNSVQDILDNCNDPLRGCDAISISSGPGEITVTGLLLEPHVLLKVFRPNWTVAFECLDAACADPQIVSGLSNGTHNVEIKLFDEEWQEICTILESVAVSGSANRKVENADAQRLSIDHVYPNPSNFEVTFEMYSPKDQNAPIDFYNQQGQLVYRMEAVLLKGRNAIRVNVSDWESGVYHVLGRGEGSTASGRFLRMWED